ncbi:MAG: DUF87 domain-containing protein [Planctomycetota bacterium]
MIPENFDPILFSNAMTNPDENQPKLDRNTYEKLGQFYLGKQYDMGSRERLENLLMYDSKDLCTHAVVVGMTGSGKTGLCIGLLEEAAMDRIPSLVIDPKGDIANLLLTFPSLKGEDFRPWIDESQAAKKGMTPDDYAESEAEKWKKGLGNWGQDGERIRELRETVDMRIYTPGSNTGRPLTILKSFAAPSSEIVNDNDLFYDRISSATSGLLALLGIDADPINSTEHILISKILEHSWRKGKDLDLGRLIRMIQDPPFEQVGIMELDAVCPPKERQQLAMTLNNLLASPSFAGWLAGEPLDIKRMLHNDDGKPCISIVSIAHLSDKERMFFVTILLNELISWMRTQAGTSSLRSLFYMDEVFGYFPPTKNPPSKQPMLTLLKQARAFGLGCVLATQNPVDLDYKGLSNAGTWFLGRLQTERDKARVLEGLEGASSQAGSTFDRSAMEETLAGLGSRVFLMNNVHEDHPSIFETRWVMSYLRGPLTRNQIQTLVKQDEDFQAKKESNQTDSPTSTSAELSQNEPLPAVETSQPVSTLDRQVIPDKVNQYYVVPEERVTGNDRLVYRPRLFARGRLHFVRTTYHVDQWVDKVYLAVPTENDLPHEVWEQADLFTQKLELESNCTFDKAEFDLVGPALLKSENFRSWKKEFAEFLYRAHEVKIWRCEDIKEYSVADESLGEFKIRIEQQVSEKRDEAVDKIRERFGRKFATLRGQMRRAEDRVEIQKEQYRQTRLSSYLSIGQTIMGALLGRKTTRSAGTSVRSIGRTSKEKSDISRAEDNLEELQIKFENLEHEFNQSIAEMEDKLHVDNLEYTELTLSPRKSDITVEEFGIAWFPLRIDTSNREERIF